MTPLNSLRLAIAFLRYRRIRTFVTLIVLIVAFTLFGLLDSIRVAFTPHSENQSRRLIVMPQHSTTYGLPVYIADEVKKKIPNVAVSWASWIGGYYQQPKNMILNIAVGDSYFDLYSEYKISAQALARFLQNRDSVLIGSKLAKEHGWVVGEKISLGGIPYVNRTTNNVTWTYEVAGIYEVSRDAPHDLEDQFFTRWIFFDSAAIYSRASVGWIVIKLPAGMSLEHVSKITDDANVNSRNPTKTQTEEAFQAELANQFGNVRMLATIIMVATLGMIWLLTARVIAQTAKEQYKEWGILKCLGFKNGVIILVLIWEVLIFVVGAGVVGMSLASTVVSVINSLPSLQLTIQPIRLDTWKHCLFATLVLIVGIVSVPAVQISRAKPLRLKQSA